MDLKCNFCRKVKNQVGQLSCGHKMCATCHSCLSVQLEKCYLCVLNAASISRTNIQVLSSSPSTPDDDTSSPKEKLFCINDGCDFIGSRQELGDHRDLCKFQTLSGCETESLASSVSSSSFIVAAERQEKMYSKLNKQVEQLSEALQTVADALDITHVPGTTRSGSKPGRAFGFFEVTVTALIAALAVHWYYANQDISKLLREGGVLDADDKVTYIFRDVSDVVTRARFNKRHMVLSEEILLHKYRIKLAIGATMSASENLANIWAAAVIERDDDGDWSKLESFVLSMQNRDPTQNRSYEFLPHHKGTWKENVRVHRGSLLYRQLQADTTKHTKYFRFASLLSFEEARMSGFVVDDKIQISLKLLNK